MAAATQHDDEILSSINITPLVDIFMVLLIIFMITSSVVDQRMIPLNLPKAAHAGGEAPKATGLVVDKDHRMYLDGRPMDTAAVAEALRDAAGRDAEHQVLIAADQDLAYREVVSVLDLVRGAGISKYALKVTRNGT